MYCFMRFVDVSSAFFICNVRSVIRTILNKLYSSLCICLFVCLFACLFVCLFAARMNNTQIHANNDAYVTCINVIYQNLFTSYYQCTVNSYQYNAVSLYVNSKCQSEECYMISITHNKWGPLRVKKYFRITVCRPKDRGRTSSYIYLLYLWNPSYCLNEVWREREARHILICWAISKKSSWTIFITSLVWRSRASNPRTPAYGANALTTVPPLR